MLYTEARFLASEVKPEGAAKENNDCTISSEKLTLDKIQFLLKMKMARAKKSQTLPNPNPSPLYKTNPSDTSGPIITNISGSFPIYARNATNNEVSP